MYKQVIFHLEVPFVVAVYNEFGDVPRDDVAWTMCPWWVRSMWPFLYKQNTHQNQANVCDIEANRMQTLRKDLM